MNAKKTIIYKIFNGMKAEDPGGFRDFRNWRFMLGRPWSVFNKALRQARLSWHSFDGWILPHPTSIRHPSSVCTFGSADLFDPGWQQAFKLLKTLGLIDVMRWEKDVNSEHIHRTLHQGWALYWLTSYGRQWYLKIHRHHHLKPAKYAKPEDFLKLTIKSNETSVHDAGVFSRCLMEFYYFDKCGTHQAKRHLADIHSAIKG